MQLISLEKSRSTQLFYLVAGLLAAVLLLTANQDDPGVVAAGIIVAIASHKRAAHLRRPSGALFGRS
jgi:hypothetical protein